MANKPANAKSPAPTAQAVAAYKQMLRTVLERRPSGTRQRLAEALGKNRSFVSQFSNPAYRIPIPSGHLDAIFEVCHFSVQEKELFLETYRVAHPRWADSSRSRSNTRRMTVDVPDLGKPSLNQELERVVVEFAVSAARLMKEVGNQNIKKQHAAKR